MKVIYITITISLLILSLSLGVKLSKLERNKTPEVQAIREEISKLNPSGQDVIDFLSKQYQKLLPLNLSAKVKNADELIPVLAADFQKLDKKLSKSEANEIAKISILDNKTTALTTSDDKYTAIEGGEKFDELHEYIHILSAAGGRSSLVDFNNMFNEGCINYFSEKVASKVQIKIIKRYPESSEIVKKIVQSLGNKGDELLFAMTFQGKIDQFFLSLGEAFVNGVDLNPNSKKKSFSDKKLKKGRVDEEGTAAKEIKSKVSSWNTSWINQRY